jgi:hypothetical protein
MEWNERKSIMEAIAKAELRLAELDIKKNKVTEELANLRHRLACLSENGAIKEPVQPFCPCVTKESPSEDKIRLFRSLFRGRDDVYPKYWQSKKTDKKGYSPVCKNEWKTGLCNKPKVKCSVCPNRDLDTVTDKVIRDHLEGKITIGVYPLLQDETCYFLAVDFDKKSWMEDAQTFLETCRLLHVPAALERSRSGKGCHVWVFFTSPVASSTARQLGCYILTRTMSRRHELNMDSYDRLFPNQDTMPKGGFGNLIALPLQKGPRESENTVFIDGNFQPISDQWAYLASLVRMTPENVALLVEEANQRGQVISVGITSTEEEDKPWEASPKKIPHTEIHRPLPKTIRATYSNLIYCNKY